MRSVVNRVICTPAKDMSLGNIYNLRTIASLPCSCTYLISYQQNDRPLETVTSQEEC